MKFKPIFLILTVIFLAACGTAAPGHVATIPVTGATDVSIAGYAFSPATITIKVGTTITWTNHDNVGHDVKALDGSWGSGNLNNGDTFSYTFTQAGSYAYHCAVHPNMTGTVVVQN